jgi:hypothetical protein
MLHLVGYILEYLINLFFLYPRYDKVIRAIAMFYQLRKKFPAAFA